LHDIDISPEDSSSIAGTDDLVLSVLAKTYRYLDETETVE
jgi:Tfp pilus assembly protein PilO